jgi:hypothetical protein
MQKRIVTQEELEETGAYAWPGGYPIVYVGSENATICFECAKKSLGGNDPTLMAYSTEGYDSTDMCEDCGKQIA